MDTISVSQDPDPSNFPGFLAAEKNTQKQGTRKTNNYEMAEHKTFWN